MSRADLQERLSAVGSEVERVAALLVFPAPDNLDRCAQHLESVSTELRDLRSQLTQSGANRDYFAEARRIRRGAMRTAHLLDRAAQFHQGWNRMLGAMCGGYQAGGSVVPIVRPSRFRVEG